MDSAEACQLADALRAQSARISCQEEFHEAMTAQVSQLASQIQDLVSFVRQCPKPAAPPPSPDAATSGGGAGIRLAPPERFSGEPGQCKAFLIDCSIHFEHSPRAFTSDRSKIAFMVSHLSGRARKWATAEWDRDSPLCRSLHDFQEALKSTFGPVATNREKARELSGLRQGGNSVCTYAI